MFKEVEAAGNAVVQLSDGSYALPNTLATLHQVSMLFTRFLKPLSV